MMYIIADSLHFICFRIYTSYPSLHHYFMYPQLNYLGQTVSTPLKKAAWPLDHTQVGMGALLAAKFFIQCYKFQVQDYMVSTFSQLSAF